MFLLLRCVLWLCGGLSERPLCHVYTAVGDSDKEVTAAVVVLFRSIYPEECWAVLLRVRISSPPSVLEKKQRHPCSCEQWLHSLGCTGAPGVTGPLLEGIQLAKCRRLPVFNNNHLKSLQLACSYEEMESSTMRRGREEGPHAQIQWTFSNVGSSFTWKIKEGLCVHQLLAMKVEKIHCVFLIRVIWVIFEVIPSLARGYEQR